jgi:competence protein ComEC
MAQDSPFNRKPRAKAWAAEVDAARRRAGAAAPEFGATAARIKRQLSEWALTEVAPGRLLPWLPVAFGLGVVLYFTADHEPFWWAAVPLAVAAVAVAALARRRASGFPLAVGLAGIGAGFAVATVQTLWLAHPILPDTVSSAALSGFVEKREERERSDRITLRVQQLEGRRVTVKPQRVRLAVRKGTAPAVGSFVALKAHLSPPLAPLRPGGYDFGRDMYFLRIGASGYALGAITAAAPPSQPTLWLRYAAFLDSIREAIDRRIRAALPGDRGSIASALITGKRDAISPPVNDAMYVSSLAHVLSISGYHMAVVAGIAFFFLRACLAMVPALASRRPIKKWAALGALIAAALYLVLSGSEVATQRSFIMIAIVLIGVMADRPALTFRTLTVAALCVLLLAPESVVQPSFQMSFAATLALIAGYQYGLRWRADADSSLGARVALWGGRELAGLVLASLVAGLATTPYAAYHFHRLAPYGMLANLLAMPVVSALVMPMGILGVLVMPFGFDDVFWRAMGLGLDWMIAVALWVAHLPGAVGRIQAFGTGPLLLGTMGLLLICLLRTPLRLSGAAVVAAACVWAAMTPRWDVLVAGDGRAAAIRGPDGRLSVLFNSRDAFAIKEWLAADGDPRDPKDASLPNGIACDAVGCVGRLADGRLVSFAQSLQALEEDCARAAVVVSQREAKAPCAAKLVDRSVWREKGALALRFAGGRFEESVARPIGFDRPWGHGPANEPIAAPARPSPRDATPPKETLEAGD